MRSIKDFPSITKRWTITRYASDEDFRQGRPTPVIGGDGQPLQAVSVFDGNLLLNEGITALQNLLCGNAETSFANANANIGVGDDNTAEAATQTGLLAATNLLYKAVEAGYPSITNQTTTWRAIFGSTEANYSWNEFTVASGNSNAADNLNRKVSAQGTKASGQTWTIDLAITWS